MAGLNDYDCEGTLVIGGVSMNRPAWGVFGDEQGDGALMGLITNITQRGEDRVLPYANGVIAYPRRNTVTTHELRLLVVGDVDDSGAAVADHAAGLTNNLQYIMANVVAPVASTTGTRSATYTPPDGTPLTADIHVVGLSQTRYWAGTNAIWAGRLRISIPAGAFT